MFGFLVGRIILRIAQLITGVRAVWHVEPSSKIRVYFANHASHADFILIWSALPFRLRYNTSPVAAKDYWNKNSIRRFIIHKVFAGVLIHRHAQPEPDAGNIEQNPIEQMICCLRSGKSLILFPEGTRNTTEAPLLPFKSGLYHLAKKMPMVEFVPVWISNLNRVMPKGTFIPLPLLSTITFGTPLLIQPHEEKSMFIDRCEKALLALQSHEGKI